MCRERSRAPGFFSSAGGGFASSLLQSRTSERAFTRLAPESGLAAQPVNASSGGTFSTVFTDTCLNPAWRRAHREAFIPLTKACDVSSLMVNIIATKPGLSH